MIYEEISDIDFSKELERIFFGQFKYLPIYFNLRRKINDKKLFDKYVKLEAIDEFQSFEEGQLELE